MIRPVPRSTMCSAAAWAMKNAPDRLTAITFMPVVVGHLGHGPVDRDPGVVDQDVEPAVLVDDLGQHAAAVVRVRRCSPRAR